MFINLQKIDSFYKGDLGRIAHGAIAPVLNSVLLGTARNDDFCICSSGCFPFLNVIQKKYSKVPLMTYQEQIVWPEDAKENCILNDRHYWPFRAEQADCVVMIHDLEFAEDPEIHLREAWRVLKGEGRLILIVPNRAGQWASHDNSPFGQGYPYSTEQLSRGLAKAHFRIDDVHRALFHGPRLPKSLFGEIYEWARAHVTRACLFPAGVFVVEASKHVYAPTKGLKEATMEKAGKILFPQAQPTSKLNGKNRHV